VRIMSVHRAKGLEFPIVFLADLGKKHNLADAHGAILVDREAGIGMMAADENKRIRYPSLAHALVEDRIKKQSLAEELRILYVAMTRAKEHLILVGTCGESANQNWHEQWSQHAGPLPAQRVLCSNTFLDWIGPVAAMMHVEKDRIEITNHSEEEVAQWAISAQRGAEMNETQKHLASLQPLKPVPSFNPQAETVKQRLTQNYDFEIFTKTPAVQSVGALTKTQRLLGRDVSSTLRVNLGVPRCAMETITLDPAEIGSATHLVMEHLDFSKKCDRDDLQVQIDEILRKKLLATSLAEAVDLDAIVWLMSTPLGTLLRKNHRSLRREVPIYFAKSATDAPQSKDPLDQVMVRGRIDMLIPDQDGIVIADYKTDRISQNGLDERVKFYTPQLAMYRDAIAAMIGKPVKSANLVFLHARTIREINK